MRTIMMATSARPGRIILWGVPMCLSTVFTRCISARGDAEIFMEPYDSCYNFGPERCIAWPPEFRSSELINDWQTYEFTKQLLEKDYLNSEIFFVKDMAFAVQEKSDMLPKGYRHTFIIRDPVKVWMAYRKRIRQLLGRGGDSNGELDWSTAGDRDLESFASPTSVFKASFDLMEYVRTELHQEPVVVDADDLIDRPADILRQYCAAVGVPYKDSMLDLGTSGGDQIEQAGQKWHCSKFFTWGEKKGGFYSKAMKSGGFVNDKKEYKITDLPREVVDCVMRSKEWYDRMYKLRLKPE